MTGTNIDVKACIDWRIGDAIEELEEVSATLLEATARRNELMIALADAGVTRSAIGIAAGVTPHGVSMAIGRARKRVAG